MSNLRPAGHHAVTPSFVVPGTSRVIGFLEKAFGAKVVDRYEGPGGTVMHAELRIGDSLVMLGQAGGPYGPKLASLYLWVPDVDAKYEKALTAGATSESAPEDKPYGHRNGGVIDPNGVTWWIGSPVAANK